ncbi:hypothetical protein CTB96_02790 [Cryobacterium arcticum]|uniref:Uncharacterized protein n=1 Tax=Cryobacterium arcticum TaxID=670052 RepID=A0A317ZX61_9MICO|nr:hypothetical protein CTB96_02790 [Cryobacterium arcticum]
MRRRADSQAILEGDTPAELKDLCHSVWERPASAADWMSTNGLESSTAEMSALAGPLSRHFAASAAWARRQGMVREGTNGMSLLDYPLMRDAGIPPHGGARMEEKMTAAGVKVSS